MRAPVDGDEPACCAMIGYNRRIASVENVVSLYILIVGLIVGGLKYMEFNPFFAKLSWWWVALPFILVTIWWEIVVPLFALDKNKEHEEFEREKAKRRDRNRSGRPDKLM